MTYIMKIQLKIGTVGRKKRREIKEKIKEMKSLKIFGTASEMKEKKRKD